MGDSDARIRPLPLVKVKEVIGGDGLEISEFEFLARGSIQPIQIIAIEKAQLYEIENGLFGPSVGPSHNGIIVDHLIKLIDAPHVTDVIFYEFGLLHRYFFVGESASSFLPLSVDELLCAGVKPCAIKDTNRMSYQQRTKVFHFLKNNSSPRHKLFERAMFCNAMGAPRDNLSVPLTCI